MPYDDYDRSIEGSRPVELYTFTSQRGVTPVVARSTSFQRDVVSDGDTYTARTIRRGAAPIKNVDSDLPEMTVQVAISDPVVRFYRGNAVAPQKLECLIQRRQLISGTTFADGTKEIFRGLITEAHQNDRTVVLTITQQLDDPLATRFPALIVSSRCQHVLYDSRCGASRALHQVDTTLATVGDFRTLTIASVGAFAEPSFTQGELLHIPSGERRHIVRGQTTKTMILDVRLPSTAAPGDAVSVWRGCDRIVATCRDRFAKVPNFGGQPHLRTSTNVFSWVSAITSTNKG